MVLKIDGHLAQFDVKHGDQFALDMIGYTGIAFVLYAGGQEHGHCHDVILLSGRPANESAGSQYEARLRGTWAVQTLAAGRLEFAECQYTTSRVFLIN